MMPSAATQITLNSEEAEPASASQPTAGHRRGGPQAELGSAAAATYIRANTSALPISATS